jgi:hypothetical protein
MTKKTGTAIALALLAAGAGWGQTTIQTNGDVEAQGFKGDGSQLTSVAADSAATAAFATDAANADKLDNQDSTVFALDADLQTLAADLAALELQVSALGTAPIRRTGQSTCYDNIGTVIFCGSTGQDGELQLGVVWPQPRFTDNGDGTVTDHLTSLVWLKDADCYGGRTWLNALAAANGLFDGATNDPLGGDCDLSDGSIAGEWRLANAQEIDSLVHFGVFDPTLPDTAGTGQWAQGDPFLDVRFATSADAYWTSTTLDSSGLAYVLDLRAGIRDAVDKDDSHSMWPVRGGQ